jgi:hypothetical protein
MTDIDKRNQECEFGKLKKKFLLSESGIVYFIDDFEYEEVVDKRIFSRRERKKTGKEFEETKKWNLKAIQYKNGENFNSTFITYNSMENNGERYMDNIHNKLMDDRKRFENMKKHIIGLEYKIIQEDAEVIKRRKKLEKLSNDKNGRL